MELVNLNAMDASRHTYTRVITDSNEFLGLYEKWEKLLAQSRISNIYLSHDWLYTWWLRFGNQLSNELSIICVYSGEALIAIAPFYIEGGGAYQIGAKNTLRIMGQAEGPDHIPCCERLDVIADIDWEIQIAVLRALYDVLRQKRSRWSNIVFQGVTDDSLLFRLHHKLARSHHDSLNIMKPALSVNLPESFEEFLTEQRQNWRSIYRGHLKIMSKSGEPEFRLLGKPEEIHAGLQSMSQILCVQQRKMDGGKCPFDSERFMRFHEDVCHLMSLKQRVKIAVLLMGGRLLGAVYYYKFEDVMQIYQIASVRGDGVHFSPSLVLMVHIIKHAIESGKIRIDFLSNCAEMASEYACVNGKYAQLYDLEWYKNRRSAYIVKSARKLSKALRS